MRKVLESAKARDQRITVPAGVVAEWWRGRTDLGDAILSSVNVEPLDESLAKFVGIVLGAVVDATLVDAIVMASAASRGDVVYTTDIEDLEKLRQHFPSVRVLTV
jgi:hypothetical protein